MEINSELTFSTVQVPYTRRLKQYMMCFIHLQLLTYNLIYVLQVEDVLEGYFRIQSKCHASSTEHQTRHFNGHRACKKLSALSPVLNSCTDGITGPKYVLQFVKELLCKLLQ